MCPRLEDMSDNATLATFAFNEHDRTLHTDGARRRGYTDYNWMMTETSNNHLIPDDERC